MGKSTISVFLIAFSFLSMLVGIVLGYLNFNYEYVEDYKIFKEMAKYSLESEYMKPYVQDHLKIIIKNILISVGIVIISTFISIILIIKVYQLNKTEKTIQEVNEININNRVYYEGKIRGLTELLFLIETHKNNCDMYGDKLIDLLEKLSYPNIVVNNEMIENYIKNEFEGSATELGVFLSEMDVTKEYHLIQKDTGKVVPLNMETLIPMLNFVLKEYDRIEESEYAI